MYNQILNKSRRLKVLAVHNTIHIFYISIFLFDHYLLLIVDCSS